MVAPILTDKDFIDLWRRKGCARAVAEHLGMAVPTVYRRRRHMERKYQIHLDSTLRPNTAMHYKWLQPVDRAARRSLTVDDGIVLVFSDAHFWPGVRTTAFRALVTAIETMKPRAVICNGDAFDGSRISRFPRIGWDHKPGVIEELGACRDHLTEIEECAGDAQLLWPLGNHDGRFENRLAQAAPEYEGVKGFTLKDHFPKWSPCWSVWINESTVVKHRYKGGDYATRNNTLFAGKTIVTGHLHSLKVWPQTDYNGDRWGVDSGTLAEPYGPQFVDYTEDNPKNWRSGFVVLTYRAGELLWPELVRVRKEGECEFRGQVFNV